MALSGLALLVVSFVGPFGEFRAFRERLRELKSETRSQEIESEHFELLRFHLESDVSRLEEELDRALQESADNPDERSRVEDLAVQEIKQRLFDLNERLMSQRIATA